MQVMLPGGSGWRGLLDVSRNDGGRERPFLGMRPSRRAVWRTCRRQIQDGTAPAVQGRARYASSSS